MSNGTKQTNDMIQATVKVHGRVQQVGYRKKVMHAAGLLDLRGFVENLEDPGQEDEKHQPVGIVCQGSRETIEKFVDLIIIKNGYIDVEKVDVSYREEFEIQHTRFCIFRGESVKKFSSRMDTAVEYLKDIKEVIRAGNKDLKESIDSGFDRTSENFKSLGNETRQFHQDSNDRFENLGNETRQFHQDSNDNFQRLDGKYHTVSEDLKGIRRAVEKRLFIEEERVGYSVDGGE